MRSDPEVEDPRRASSWRRLPQRALILGLTLSASACLDEHRPPPEGRPREAPDAPAKEADPPAKEGATGAPLRAPERAAGLRPERLDPYALRGPDDTPLIFDRAIHAAEAPDLDRLQAALAGVLDRHASLRPHERLTLQNDLWGLIVRLDQGARSTAATASLRETAAALLRRLAPRSDDLNADPMPAELERILPPEAGWRELASELPALQHELSFGDRRLFRLFRRPLDEGEALALADHLLVIDDEGRVRRTALLGEVEILRFRGAELVAAEVFELSRLGQPPNALRPVDEVSQIPGLGVDSRIAEFDPPEPLRDLPCLRCHHDDSRMSLPNASMDPRWRDAGVLRRAQASADSVWSRPPSPSDR